MDTGPVPLRRLLLLTQFPLWALTILSFVFLLGALDARVQATNDATQARVRIENLSDLLVHVLDMETGVRGYVIAGDPVFLEPYQSARAALPGDLLALRDTMRLSGTPEQNARNVDRIETLIFRWLAEIATPEINLRDTDPDAAAELVRSQRGKKLLDATRAQIAALNARETQALQAREAEAVRQLERLRLALLLAGSVLVLLGLVNALAQAGLITRYLGNLTRAAQRLTDAAPTPTPAHAPGLSPGSSLSPGSGLAPAPTLNRTGGVDGGGPADDTPGAATLERRRAPVTVQVGGPREFRELAGTFNLMSQRLQAAQQEARDRADQLAQRNTWMRSLGELSDAMQAARSLDEGARILERALPLLLPGTRGALSHHNASRNLLVPLLHWGDEAAVTHAPDHCWALRRGEVQHPDNRRFAPPCPGQSGAYTCLPLFSHGETLGLLRVANADPDQPLPDTTRALLPGVARQIALALASLRLQDRLLQQSIRDPLTGLFNRRHLEDVMNEQVALAHAEGRPLSLIALDVDHFKRLNDTFGHDAGDAALVRISAALKDAAPPGSTPARPGGEEFSLLLPGTDESGAAAIAENLRAQVAALDLRHAGIALGQITLSLGVATLNADAATPAALTVAADQALYAAKRQGRNRVELA
ncbi:sensor domain-containing diguanylate cyclase [Deinococcus knuensis]|uniref:sensor domain-containing diguanylate cyclase n=1 Tax=Deinococcus knuensis TaxID=1837380 RepID=UPI00166E60CD|nr:diguanylate cyclase [Deinococcus knuensis]